jgi:hypothetical protein
MSPVLMFFLTLDHFCRSCINVRYSCVHCLQNKLNTVFVTTGAWHTSLLW